MMVSPETLTLLVIALLNAFTTWLSFRTRRDITKLETSTNGIKDALVHTTKVAAHAAGKEEGRVEGLARAALIAEGRLIGASEQKKLDNPPEEKKDDTAA